MADPATDTTYPGSYDELPEIGPLDRQNAPGLEHDVIHTRENSVLNALQKFVGTNVDDPEPASVVDRLNKLEAGRPGEEVLQTGTSYVLVLGDAFKMVCMNNAAANTIEVPPNSSVAFAIGTRIDLSQDGAGQTTVVAGSGVTIRTPETLLLRKQWAKATLIKRGTNTWDLEGNLEAAP